MKTKLLVIDDDDFSAIQIEGLVGNDFEVEHAATGRAGIEAAEKSLPGMILMDVEMPEMDGYATCSALKGIAATQDIPVIFLSAHSDADDRLKGYTAGGEDFIAKPFVPEELRHKIAIVIGNRAKHAQLASQARTAISNMNDISVVLGFLREICGVSDNPPLAAAVLHTLRGYDLEASVQLRDRNGTFSQTTQGDCSPLEESVLTNMATCAPIVDLGARSAFNFEHVSIIIKNMPREDAERCRRLKDSVSMIAEATDIHIRSLDVLFEAIDRGDTFMRIIQRNARIMRDVERHLHAQRDESAQILNNLVKNIEESFYRLGLSDSQEEFLQNVTRDAIARSQALFDNGFEVDAIMQSLSEGLDGMLQQELQGAADAANDSNRIELF